MWCSSNTRQQIEAIESSLQLPETRLIISTINHIPYNRRKAIKCPNLSFNAKKGGGREASPFSVQAYGSVPSTGQRRPGLPRADPAVLSARWGLASGFGTGPGVPPMLWPLTGGRRPPYLRCPVSHSRALGAAWRIGKKLTRGHPRARTALLSAQSRGPRGAVPEELGRLVRLG